MLRDGDKYDLSEYAGNRTWMIMHAFDGTSPFCRERAGGHAGRADGREPGALVAGRDRAEHAATVEVVDGDGEPEARTVWAFAPATERDR